MRPPKQLRLRQNNANLQARLAFIRVSRVVTPTAQLRYLSEICDTNCRSITRLLARFSGGGVSEGDPSAD